MSSRRWSALRAASKAARAAFLASRATSPSAQPAVEPLGAGDHRQGAGHHGRVTVDPRGVDDSAEAGPVELGRGQRAVLGPVVLLPVEHEGGAAAAAAHGILDGPQRLGHRGGAGEVDPAQPHAGVREVNVRVDEGGQHQCAVEVDDGVDDLGMAFGALLVADPADPAVDDHEGGRVRSVGGADPPAAVERRRHGATLGARSGRPRRRASDPRRPYGDRMAIPRAVGKFNKVATNKVLVHLAGHGPFVELEHVGRRSGRVYHVPLNAFRSGDTVTFALTYGPKVDWLRNVRAAGGCRVRLGRDDSHAGSAGGPGDLRGPCADAGAGPGGAAARRSRSLRRDAGALGRPGQLRSSTLPASRRQVR